QTIENAHSAVLRSSSIKRCRSSLRLAAKNFTGASSPSFPTTFPRRSGNPQSCDATAPGLPLLQPSGPKKKASGEVPYDGNPGSSDFHHVLVDRSFLQQKPSFAACDASGKARRS